MAVNPEKEPKSKSSPSAIGQILKIPYYILSTPFWLLSAILKKISPSYLTPISIILTGAMISASIILASLIISLSISPGEENGTAQTGLNSNSQPVTPNSKTQSPIPAAEAVQNQIKLENTDRIRGGKNARYVLIEYSDLECPFCKKLHPDLKKILSVYNNQISWVYRHFPIDSNHPKARKEAEAVECAAEQGGSEAFWKYIDKVFEITPANNGLDPAQLPQIADQIGLDGSKLQTCIDSGKMGPIVETQYQGGLKAGINGTPGTFILDTKSGKSTLITGALPYDEFKSQIDSFISQTEK
jgi:protein-disulfide isomerase